MNQDWQIDLEILEHIRKFEAKRAEMLLYLRNGPEIDFFVAWSDLDGIALSAQRRLNRLRDEKRVKLPRFETLEEEVE